MASGSYLGQQKLYMCYGHWGLLTILRNTHLPIFFFFNFKFYFIFKLYKIVLVLPNIKMNPPQVYTKKPRLNGARSLGSV